MAESARALDGVVVVSLEHAVAAPFATRQLADLGARVIKIERPEGDFARYYDDRVNGLCSHFVWCNRSKESLTLDLKSDFGRTAMDRLLDRADVFVQNLTAGATARMNCDYESLKTRFPRLIVCDISGYGQDGPYRDRRAYDALIQSESGFLSVTGTPDEMAKAGCAICDIAAGMYAFSNILAALIERGRTGRGKHIDISMLEATAEWLGFPMYYSFDGASPPPRAGASHPTIFPYGPFSGRDGDVVLSIQNDREWVSFCQIVLERSDLLNDARFKNASSRSDHRHELGPIIASVFGDMTCASLIERLNRAKIANARANDMAGLWAHPQLAARKRWVEVDTPAGKIPALLPPGQTNARMAPVPSIGAHTRSILQEIGLPQEGGETEVN